MQTSELEGSEKKMVRNGIVSKPSDGTVSSKRTYGESPLSILIRARYHHDLRERTKVVPTIREFPDYQLRKACTNGASCQPEATTWDHVRTLNRTTSIQGS